jgi:hypothetical protein
MVRARRPRIWVESADPRFRTYSLISLEDFGGFVVDLVDPTRSPCPSSPPPDLLLLDRRWRPFALDRRSEAVPTPPRSLDVPIVIVTDLPHVPEVAHEFGTGRPVHVLRDSWDPQDLCDEVTRIWDLHLSLPRTH